MAAGLLNTGVCFTKACIDRMQAEQDAANALKLAQAEALKKATEQTPAKSNNTLVVVIVAIVVLAIIGGVILLIKKRGK